MDNFKIGRAEHFIRNNDFQMMKEQITSGEITREELRQAIKNMELIKF